MIFDDSEYNNFTLESSDQYRGLQASLGTGPGEVTGKMSVDDHQMALMQRSHVSPTYYTSSNSVAATMPYIQSEYSYKHPLSPLKPMNSKRSTSTDNVTVKEGSEARKQLIKYLFLVVFGIIVCGIPLAVISTLYAQATNGSTSTIAASNSIVSLPSQCTSYTINNDTTRNVAYGSGSACDNLLTTGWYRFMGGAGTQLATIYVSRDTCNTYYGGSYNGSLPSTVGITVYGTLCLNNNGYLCYAAWSGSLIGVTNCSGYYVYYLSPIMNCNARYCTTA